MANAMHKSYEVLIYKDKNEVYIPLINPTVDLEHEDTKCSFEDGCLKVSDKINSILFSEFPLEHWELIKSHKKLCFLDVSCAEHLKDFDVPVDVFSCG